MSKEIQHSLLIIEDDNLIAGFYTTVFDNLGLEVYRVATAEEIDSLTVADVSLFNIVFISEKARLEGLHLQLEKKLDDYARGLINWLVMADVKTSTIHFTREDEIHLFDTAEYNLHGIVSRVQAILGA